MFDHLIVDNKKAAGTNMSFDKDSGLIILKKKKNKVLYKAPLTINQIHSNNTKPELLGTCYLCLDSNMNLSDISQHFHDAHSMDPSVHNNLYQSHLQQAKEQHSIEFISFPETASILELLTRDSNQSVNTHFVITCYSVPGFWMVCTVDKSTALMSSIDEFLRQIWLGSCKYHFSKMSVQNALLGQLPYKLIGNQESRQLDDVHREKIQYVNNMYGNSRTERCMDDSRVNDVLKVGKWIVYEYDLGAKRTEVLIQVVGECCISKEHPTSLWLLCCEAVSALFCSKGKNYMLEWRKKVPEELWNKVKKTMKLKPRDQTFGSVNVIARNHEPIWQCTATGETGTNTGSICDGKVWWGCEECKGMFCSKHKGIHDFRIAQNMEHHCCWRVRNSPRRCWACDGES